MMTAFAPIFTIIYALACLFLGSVLIRSLLRKEKNRTQFPLYALLGTGFLLGQGILANIWLFLGLVSWFKVSLIWTILIIIIILGILLRPYNLEFWQKIKNDFLKLKKLTFIWKLFLVLVGILILSYAIQAIILPPFEDAEGFYMVLPKIMAGAEKLFPQPNYYSFSQIGFSGEMHFAALMAISNAAAAKFFTWITAISATVILLSVCNFSGAKIKAQIIALIMLFTSTAFVYYIADGKVDIYGAAFGLAAYYWVLQTYKKNSILPLILTGLFAGFAFVAKFPNAIVILPGILLIIIWNNYLKAKFNALNRKEFLLNLFISLLITGAFFTLATAPQLIKNWVFFNEPLAPFIFFKSQGWNWADQSWFSPETTKFILLTYPIALIFGQYPLEGGNLSVLILAFLPLFLFLKIQKNFWQSKLFQVVCLALTGLILWMIIRPAVICPRYILATLLLIIVPVAITTEKVLLIMKSKFLNLIILSSTLVVLCFSILFSGWIFYLLSQNRDIHFLNPYYKSMNYLDQKADFGDRVYLAGFYSYFLRPDLLQCMGGNPEDGVEKKGVNVPEALFQRGFRYLLVQKQTHQYFLGLLNDSPSWLTLEKIYEDDNAMIYSIKTINLSSHQTNCSCQSKNQKKWEVVCQ